MSEFDDFDNYDEKNFPRPEDTDFSRLINRAISRRSFLKTGASFSLTSFVTATGALAIDGLTNLGGVANAASAVEPTGKSSSAAMGFSPVAATSADTITLPPGYNWHVVARWGDPLFNDGVPFDQETRGTGASQELAFGDNCDGLSFYPTSEQTGILAVNNEYVNSELFAPDGFNTPDAVRKAKAAHGVSIVEIRLESGQWRIDKSSGYNRRITADTPMDITGPARGDALMQTASDPKGVVSLGTWNNCGSGATPWGTYLTCEENFNYYFGTNAESFQSTRRQRRYGLGGNGHRYNWHTFDDRFDIAKNPNEPHRSGWVVEIDPMDSSSTPKKRTALGRFKHENCEIVIDKSGHVVAYMGDDERGEYLYRFISNNKYIEGNTPANRNLLEEGTLYVARFNEADKDLKGTGEWIEISHGKNGLVEQTGFNSQAEVMIFAREAALKVQATTMDRPEWVAANPNKAEVFVALTNNTNRGNKPNSGGADTPVNGPNPRKGNPYGQVLRWVPDESSHLAKGFTWDLFVLAGNPAVHSEGLMAGSANVTPDNMFNSPDGLVFDNDGRLWIQTDGNYSDKDKFAGMGNNQMLCADTETGEIRRFMVGPVACEITGASWSADQRTMFVSIQHPGEKNKESHFPDGGISVPRSSVIAITRADGGVVGA
ncbi:MAG: PhoX family phosphatase [Burkholderiaceae bacterium]